jgi:hypothetical protein
LARLQIGEYGGKIATVVDRCARGEANRHIKFMGNDRGKRGLPQSWRPMKEQVICGLATLSRRLEKRRKCVLRFELTDVFV